MRRNSFDRANQKLDETDRKLNETKALLDEVTFSMKNVATTSDWALAMGAMFGFSLFAVIMGLVFFLP